MRRAHPEVPCHLAPIDHPWCVERRSAHRSGGPRADRDGAWPSWLAAAERRDTVALVSGACRITPTRATSGCSGSSGRRCGGSRRSEPAPTPTPSVWSAWRVAEAHFCDGRLKLEPADDMAPLAPDLPSCSSACRCSSRTARTRAKSWPRSRRSAARARGLAAALCWRRGDSSAPPKIARIARTGAASQRAGARP